MRPQDLHTHSLFDDGRNSLEEMVCAAAGKGLSAIGLSGHSPIPGEHDWTIQPERLPDYLKEGRRLQEKYRERIPVYVGIEYDLRSSIDLSDYDYVIGSIHALAGQDVDNNADISMDIVRKLGDADTAAECYFAQYREIAENPEIDIVGHFDLLTKFDEITPIYNPQSPRYQRAAMQAMELLVRAGKIFEVNSGAISRGYRSSPYPARELLCCLRALDGKLCLNSDAHSTDAIGFARSLELVRDCGFEELWMLTPEGFRPIPIAALAME